MVAERIGAPNDMMVTRWERGTAFPSAYCIERLCQLFEQRASDLGLLPELHPMASSQPFPDGQPRPDSSEEWAHAILPSFELTEANARTISEICVRLDGLPLAIELAAARIKLLPPQALLARLSRRLEVLTGGARDLPNRQQTLRNTLQWSYDPLTSQEQRLFRRLSVFVGGCTLQAAAAVCYDERDDGEELLDVLEGSASLVDKSFVLQTAREGDAPRLLMLETIREYGLECLEASGETATTRRAHARYYLDLAQEASAFCAELCAGPAGCLLVHASSAPRFDCGGLLHPHTQAHPV